MISRRVKATFYALTGPFMWVSGLFYRNFLAPASNNSKRIYVHLGPGKKNYIKDWINVDANFLTAQIDVWADFTNSLPFKNASVDFFYSHHVIEHLPDLSFQIQELYRCLKPGAALRIGGPNGDSAIHRFVANDLAWFGDFPDKRQSIGGRFENFIFCRREHLTILTFSYLEELLQQAGFVNVKLCMPTRETHHPDIVGHDIFSKEWESDFTWPHTIIVEADKPA